MERTNEPLLEKAIKEGRRSKTYSLRNETGLPDIAVQYCEDRAAEYPNHDDNVISVTTLKKPYKVIMFGKTLADVAGRDVQDLFPSADGTAVHDSLQLTALKRPDRYIPEKRINVEMDGTNLSKEYPSLILSGEFDCYDKQEDELIDYKNTKQGMIDENFSGKSDDFELQLNLYSWLFFKEYGFYPKKYRILARCKDHSKVKQVATGSDKNACQYKFYDVTEETRKKYLDMAREKMPKIWLMLNGKMPVPDCTPEEQWRKDDVIVSKPVEIDKLKDPAYKPPRAFKVCESYDEARTVLLQNNGKGYRIYRRYSEPVFCKCYCQFKNICNQYKTKESTHAAFYEDITNGDMPF